jgi:uncharacterized protein YbjT (DUF2867 family)
MRIAIAGGTGFLGRHLVDALRRMGHELVLLSRGTREPAPPAVEWRACDATHALAPGILRGCDALVNLIGIKREEGRQTFERAHVEATRHLLEAAAAGGVRRFVHVSVVSSRPDPSSGYHDSKWRAEELVRRSSLAWTIFKPGVIYGRGDDMLTHLVKMIRFAPLFPVVGRGQSVLQPVSAHDVAAAIAASLSSEEAIGGSYDCVGPERLPLREVVRRVAAGVGLRTFIISTPVWFQRAAVHVMNSVTRRPLSTPAQLRMLIEGMPGDPEPARRELGVEPARLTHGAVAEIAGAIPPLFGFSLRLVASREHRAWLASRKSELPGALLLLILAWSLVPALSPHIGSIWGLMGAANAVLLLAAFSLLRPGWKELLAPKLRHLPIAAGAACFLLLAAGLISPFLTADPSLASQAAAIRGWREQVPPWLAVLLLTFVIVPGEEVFWRGAVTLPVAAKLGAWPGCIAASLAFAAAHIAAGPPLLWALAAAAGFFWSWLAVKSRSLVPSLASHLLFDVAALWWLPL